jgi:hypothetical protein
MKNVWFVVPIGKRQKYIPQLLESLAVHKGKIVFVNNYVEYEKYDGVHHIEDFGDLNISRWWNVGIDYCLNNGASHVFILNDDISFSDSFIDDMMTTLINNNSAICSATGGGGSAFVMDLKYNLRADEELKWWCGDGDIFRQAYESAGFCWHNDPTFLQLESTVLTYSTPGLLEIANKDIQTYRKKLERLGKSDFYG